MAHFTGGRITVADVERAAANKVPRVRVRMATDRGRAQLLDELVRWELLVAEAKRRGYAASPVVYEATTKAAVLAMEQRDLAVDPASIASEEVASYYAAHRDSYDAPEARRASVITLRTEAEASALVAALAGVDRIRFAALARERSIDETTRTQGGELGYFDREGRQRAHDRRRRVPAELVEAAFSLATVGAVTKVPVPYAGGFAVLMLTGKMPAIDRPLAAVDDEIRDRLAGEHTQKAVEALLARLRAENEPVVHAELLDLISLEDVPPRDIPHGFPAAPRDPYAPSPTVEPDGV